jgi:hypothetical protein
MAVAAERRRDEALATEREAAIVQIREKAKADVKGRMARSLAPLHDRHRDEQHGSALNGVRNSARRCWKTKHAPL